jgi:hypothetical protein
MDRFRQLMKPGVGGACTSNRVVLPARKAGDRFLGSIQVNRLAGLLKRLHIRAQSSVLFTIPCYLQRTNAAKTALHTYG